MKRFTPEVLWLLGGGVHGILTGTVLDQLWAEVSWRRLVAEWLASCGQAKLAGYWGLVWIHLPDWFVSAIGGIWAGMFVKRQPIVPLLVFGIGFVVGPLLASFLAGFDFAAFGFATLVRTLRWNCSSVAIVLLFGVLSHQFRWRRAEAEIPEA